MPRGYHSDGTAINAKLTKDEADLVLHLSQQGWTAARISSCFPQVTEATVRSILAGRTYRTLEQRWSALHPDDLEMAAAAKASVR